MASTNITTFPGKVGVSNANPTHTLSIGSNVFVDDTGTNKLVVLGSISTTGTLSGDGSGISNIQSSNVNDFVSNVTRIGTLETDLDDNSSRISTVSTDLDDNSSRISTVSTDLSDNSSRISTVSTDLSDNSSRITVLESGDTNITGKKTFTEQVTFESNIHVKGDLLVANTVNMTVSDPILELGSNNLNTGDIGLVMTRHGASNSNVAVFFDETADTLKLGYTLNGAGDSTLEFDSNALAVSIQGTLEVDTANVNTMNVSAIEGLQTLSFSSDSTTVPPLQLTAGSLNDGVGALRIDSVEPDIFLNDTDGGFSTVTFANNDVARAAFGRNDGDDFYITVRDPATNGGNWRNTTLVVDSSSGNVSMAYGLTVGSNVGIGTDAPAYELDVTGNIHFTGGLYQDGAPFVSSLWTGGTDSLYYRSNVEVGTGNLFVDTTTSNVGIGTTTPAYSLDVVGDINLSGDFYQGGSPFVSSLWTSSGTDLYYNSGSVGISNTAPDHDLSVGSNLYVHDTGSNVLVVDGNVSVSNTITTQRLTLNNVSISTTMNLQQVTDVGNVTSNTVQFTNPTTAFVTTGNVGVGTTEPTESLDIVGNLNLQKVSNTASIKLNSNVVTEYTRSKKLIKYPRVALGTNSTSYSGLLGGSTVNGYTIKASDEYNSDFVTSKAFTNTRLDDADTWISGSSAYNSTTKLPVTNSATTTKFGQDGSWLEIKLPNAIQLHYIHVFSRNTHITERIDTADIWASNTGTDGDWVKLTTISFNADYTDTNPMVGNIDTWTYYQYFAIQITKIGWAGTYTNVGEWELYGVPEYDPEAHGADVIMRSVPNVPNTDWLEVYYDGQDYTSMPSTVTDKSGNSVTGTPNGGVGFDTEYKAFTFDGVDDYISGTLSNPAGDWTHSASLWMYPGDLSATNEWLYWIGTNTTGGGTGLQFTSTSLKGTVKGGSSHFVSHGLSSSKWVHVAVVYSAKTFGMYLNGIKLSGTVNIDTDLLNLPQNTTLYVGARPPASLYFTGKIANFRLFNRALSADEVWQLYAYQKEYFDVSPDVVTFKGGRLGIGTSEPRAQLDVRGSARFGGDIKIYGNMTYYIDPFKLDRSVLNSLSPTVWAVAGESTARVGGGAISYSGQVTIEYLNGTPMWYMRGRDENVDILNTISSTTNTWTIAIAIAKKPQSKGILFTQLPNGENSSTNHIISWIGNITGDEFSPSGNGWNIGNPVSIPDESVLVVRKNGTGTNGVTVWLNGGIHGTGTNPETYNGTTSNRIRLGQRGRYAGYVNQTPLHIGFAAVAAWDSVLTDNQVADYLNYQSITAY